MSVQSFSFNERLIRQTTGINDHDQYGANADKNCSTGSGRQFSGLSNGQPVGLSFGVQTSGRVFRMELLVEVVGSEGDGGGD